MVQITYSALLILISSLWILFRIFFFLKTKQFRWKRELQLMLVYICIIVVARFTFFPFSKVDGQIQPLVFEAAKALPFRINLVPFVYLFDYPAFR